MSYLSGMSQNEHDDIKEVEVAVASEKQAITVYRRFMMVYGFHPVFIRFSSGFHPVFMAKGWHKYSCAPCTHIDLRN